MYDFIIRGNGALKNILTITLTFNHKSDDLKENIFIIFKSRVWQSGYALVVQTKGLGASKSTSRLSAIADRKSRKKSLEIRRIVYWNNMLESVKIKWNKYK